MSFAAGYEGRPSAVKQTDLTEKDSSPPGSTQSHPLLMASGDSVYVLWLQDFDLTESSSYEQHMLMRVSADGGRTFGSVTTLEDITTVPEFGAAATVAAFAVGGSVAAAQFIGHKRATLDEAAPLEARPSPFYN